MLWGHKLEAFVMNINWVSLEVAILDYRSEKWERKGDGVVLQRETLNSGCSKTGGKNQS